MSGKHDKFADDEQSRNLLLSGPITILGIGRGVKRVLVPAPPSRHRASGRPIDRTSTFGVDAMTVLQSEAPLLVDGSRALGDEPSDRLGTDDAVSVSTGPQPAAESASSERAAGPRLVLSVIGPTSIECREADSFGGLVRRSPISVFGSEDVLRVQERPYVRGAFDVSSGRPARRGEAPAGPAQFARPLAAGAASEEPGGVQREDFEDDAADGERSRGLPAAGVHSGTTACTAESRQRDDGSEPVGPGEGDEGRKVDGGFVVDESEEQTGLESTDPAGAVNASHAGGVRPGTATPACANGERGSTFDSELLEPEPGPWATIYELFGLRWEEDSDDRDREGAPPPIDPGADGKLMEPRWIGQAASSMSSSAIGVEPQLQFDDVQHGPTANFERAGSGSGDGPSNSLLPTAASAPSRAPRGWMKPRVRRSSLPTAGTVVIVVVALVCAALATAVVVKTRHDAAIATSEAAGYRPGPLGTERAPSGPVIAIIGDDATSSARPGVKTRQRWFSLLASSLGGATDVQAARGMGYATRSETGNTFERAARTLPADATIVLFFGGAADKDVGSVPLAKAATNAFSLARKQAPDARILVVGPATSGGVSATRLASIRGTLHAAARLAGASWVDPFDEKWLPSPTRPVGALSAVDEKTLAMKMEDAVMKALS